MSNGHCGRQRSCQSVRPCRPKHMRFYYDMLACRLGASGAAKVSERVHRNTPISILVEIPSLQIAEPIYIATCV